MFKKRRKLLWLFLLPYSLWGITISTYTILTKDVVYNEDVIVGENVILELNNHKMTVHGDFNITGGKLKMVQVKDKLIVHGDITFNGKASDDLLTNGIIEVSGNFYQKGVDTYSRSFYATGEHKVILNGNSKQIVDFQAPLSSSFNHLEVKNSSNEGVVFNVLNAKGEFKSNGKNVKISKITNLKLMEDLTIFNDVNVIGGILNLNGHRLSINGSLRISGKYGRLKMNNPNDHLVVNENLTFRGASTSRFLTEGVINLKGDFTQAGEDGTHWDKDYEGFYAIQNYNAFSFYASSNHKIVLDGSKQQIVDFSSAGYSQFNNLEIVNEEIAFRIKNNNKIRIANALYTTNSLYNSLYKESDVISFKKYRDVNYVYLELEAGQHLITLPVADTLTKSQIETVFSDKNISYILKHDFDSNEWQGYSTNSVFKQKMKDFKVSELSSLKAGEGIVIDVNEPITLKFPKSDDYSLFDKVDIPNLARGWHFLGSNRLITIKELLSKNSNIKVLWHYQESKWSVYSEDEDIKEEYRRREIPSFEDINTSNSAFWLYVE